MLATRRLLSPIFLLLLVSCVVCIALSTRANNSYWVSSDIGRGVHAREITRVPDREITRRMRVPPNLADPNLAQGLAAWERVYSVLISPRCINCHTATDYPQQGDDRHRHFANVVRGGHDGQGVPALYCVGCHQDVNADSTGVPGGPNWHLAPLSMKWQDTNDRPLSSAAVCRAVTDRSRNENMDGPALLKHHEDAPLVLWAWNPGRRIDGSMRTVPPLSHADFVNATRIWVEAGTPCPRGK